MRNIAVLAGAAVLGLSSQAYGYSASGTVTFAWGGNSSAIADAGSAYGATSDSTADIGWTANGTSALGVMTDSTYFTAQNGYNSRGWYNGDFTVSADCTIGGAVVPGSATSSSARKYGCRYNSTGGTQFFASGPISDTAAATTGASATGSITVTDTTLTGTLTLNSTTDEPTGATTTFTAGLRTSNSVGNGLNGYNYRSADGSPFGNYWQGTTTAGTLVLNLTGTFTNGSWSITGGTVGFSDAGFACQQGGLGGTGLGTLCLNSGVAGGQNTTNGSSLSWGVDIDGAATGNSAFTEISVRNAVGGAVIESLSGVLASVAVSGGNVTTNSGEFRRALGSSGSGCSTYIVWDGTRVSCGTLTTGLLNISGTVTESVVPVPAAVWLMGSALGLLGWARRKANAA